MKYKFPKTRDEAIKIIIDSGNLDEFIDVYAMNPEEYYDEYCDEEENTWLNTFNDMGIDVKGIPKFVMER